MVDGNWLNVRYHPMMNEGSNGVAVGVMTAGIAAVFFKPGHDAEIIKGRTYDVFADESTYVATAVAASAPLVTRVLPQAPLMIVRQANGGPANNGGLPPAVNTAGNPVIMSNTSVMNTAATQGAMVGMGDSGMPATLSINANQPGADIEVDGMFVGNAPTTIQLASGSHQLVLRHGSAVWQREHPDHRRSGDHQRHPGRRAEGSTVEHAKSTGPKAAGGASGVSGRFRVCPVDGGTRHAGPADR